MKENDYIKKNIEEVRSRIETAALRNGRNYEDVAIIAVTKTVDTGRIKTAVDEGILNLGENKVQEICEKYDNIEGGYSWHLIGHLQTNKVKHIIDKVKMIHSVDRIELAQEIQKRAEKAGRVMDVLVQVNVAEEATKFGISPESVKGFLNEISQFKNLKVKGLMTIAPYVENPEEVRWVFRELRKIFIDINKENINNIDMDYLSMGMSNDFEVAIEEGSNMVRVGTAIFGKRQY